MTSWGAVYFRLTVQQIFEKLWKYAKEVVDLEKVCDRLLRDKLRAVLFQYSIDGQLVTTFRSLPRVETHT